MTDKERPRDPAPSEDKAQVSKRKTIPASDVGVSLTVSDKALKEVERLQEETIKAAREVHKFSWCSAPGSLDTSLSHAAA